MRYGIGSNEQPLSLKILFELPPDELKKYKLNGESIIDAKHADEMLERAQNEQRPVIITDAKDGRTVNFTLPPRKGYATLPPTIQIKRLIVSAHIAAPSPQRLLWLGHSNTISS
jgi:hypothetical protein